MLKLGADRIRELLMELGRRLSARGVTADLYVVGGAAFALAYDERRVTDDIDAVFTDKLLIYELSLEMAQEHALPEGWLNDAAKGFILSEDPDRVSVMDVPGLRVQVASAPLLFAMKCMAHRPEDGPDVRLLARSLDIANPDAALDLLEAVVGARRISAEAAFFVRAVLDPFSGGGDPQ